MHHGTHVNDARYIYEAATISRLLKNIGLFAKEPYKRNLYSSKETYILKEPTSHSHHIGIGHVTHMNTHINHIYTNCQLEIGDRLQM